MNSVQADRELTIPKAGTAMFFRFHSQRYRPETVLPVALLQRIAAFILAAVAFVLPAGSGRQGISAESRRAPNIVFVLADDLGWADLACYGSTVHETPHLDRFARQACGSPTPMPPRRSARPPGRA